MHRTESPSLQMLIVEDDADIRQGLEDFFSLQGYEVSTAADGEQGFERLREHPDFDLLLLDLMLPKKDGFELLRDMRALGITLPVVVLTARSEERDLLKGFVMGVDDYVTKPFSVDVLAARVKAILQRRLPDAEAPMEIHRFGEVEVNFSTHEVYRGTERLHMTAQEFNLLEYLITYRGRAISREQCLRDVWGITGDVVTRTVDRHIAALRKKIEPNPRQPVYIETVYGKGYRLK